MLPFLAQPQPQLQQLIQVREGMTSCSLKRGIHKGRSFENAPLFNIPLCLPRSREAARSEFGQQIVGRVGEVGCGVVELGAALEDFRLVRITGAFQDGGHGDVLEWLSGGLHSVDRGRIINPGHEERHFEYLNY